MNINIVERINKGQFNPKEMKIHSSELNEIYFDEKSDIFC